jgi:hypothetical protein
MAPKISLQTVLVPATPTSTVERGLLVFAEDVLVAVVMHLDASVTDLDLHGRWYLETGYGPCAQPPGTDLIFSTLGDVQRWVLERCADMQADVPSSAAMVNDPRPDTARRH